ncbi:hypothetical protein ABZ825_20210 [Streptomyces tauricus]
MTAAPGLDRVRRLGCRAGTDRLVEAGEAVRSSRTRYRVDVNEEAVPQSG